MITADMFRKRKIPQLAARQFGGDRWGDTPFERNWAVLLTFLSGPAALAACLLLTIFW